MRLVRQCHAKTHISPVAAWHQGSLGLEHYLGRWIMDLATHAQNIADGTDGRYEGDLRMLDTAVRCLLLVCIVVLSLTIDNALKFGMYF